MVQEAKGFDIMNMPGIEQANWWIITGGPRTGKTTLLENLKARGYKTREEAARELIDYWLAIGYTIEEIRRDEMEFQISVLREKERIEDAASPDELVLWDRGLHGDSAAYFAFASMSKKPDTVPNIFGRDIITVVNRRYRGVFLLDRLPYSKDYARTENEEQAAWVHSAIELFYRAMGYDPIRVPVMPVIERAQFVINKIREKYPDVPDLPYRGPVQQALPGFEYVGANPA